MPSRRQFVFIAATAAGVWPVLSWLVAPSPAGATDSGRHFPVEKTEGEWRAILTPTQYDVLRGHGTEPPFSSPLEHEKRHGTFVCAGCAHPLFSFDTKFDSGTGWPSFWKPLDRAVDTSVDRSWFMVRTEVHCARCGGHLGHLFNDGPPPTGLRYCIDGVAMSFQIEPVAGTAAGGERS